METITMSEMLETMNTGLPFSISFVTYDKQRKRGGEIRKYKEVVLNVDISKNKQSKKETKKGEKPISEKRVKVSRNPNHFENSTRSFRVCVNGCKTATVKKFHLFLVLDFNGKKLML